MVLTAQAPLPDNRTILNAWLTLYNNGDTASLGQFQQTYMGNDQIAYVMDSREESGGFDLMKIESDVSLKLTALLKARGDGSPWELTMVRETATLPALRNFRYTPAPQSESQNLTALDAFATRLNRVDKFSGVLALYRSGTPLFEKSWD